jgi:uncharacterized membrane protein
MEKLFSEADREMIIAAIKEAEKNTSGEIRVHLEKTAGNKSAFQRATEVFIELKMEQTAARNGVLIYLAGDDRQFAIIGDKGIDAVVPENFWETVKDIMQQKFKDGNFTQGLVDGILSAGHELKLHFPYHNEDKDELSNDISFGK